jgi:hypothetical protein
MQPAQLTLFFAFALFFGGCTTGQNKPAGQRKAFMDEKKQIPAGLEWNRDFFAKKEGTVNFRVTTTEGPFAITCVTDNAWQALQANDMKRIKKEDGLHKVDSKGAETTLEGTVKVPAGRAWIIVENRNTKPVEIHIQLFSQ